MAFLSWLEIKGKMSRSALAGLSETDLYDALFFANKAASIVCSRRGADPPTRKEVESLKIPEPKAGARAKSGVKAKPVTAAKPAVKAKKAVARIDKPRTKSPAAAAVKKTVKPAVKSGAKPAGKPKTGAVKKDAKKK